MKTKIIRTREEFLEIREPWNEIVSNGSFDTPFCSFNWYDKWLKHFGKSYKPFIVVVENTSAEILGIAPFVMMKNKLRGVNVSELKFIDNGLGPRNCLIYRNDDSNYQAFKAIVECIAEHRNEWDYVSLVKMDEKLDCLSAFENYLKQSNLYIIKESVGAAPYLTIKSDFQTYLSSKFNSAQRRSRKRALKSLEAEGNHKFICFKTSEELMQGLELAFRISKASWKGDIGTDMACSDASKSFYMDITRIFGQSNNVRIWVIFFEDNAIAFQYHLVYANIVYFLVGDFDKVYSRLAPGTALMYNIVKNYHDEAINELDFCGGDYDYKMKWADDIRKYVDYQIFSNKLYSKSIYISKKNVLPFIRNTIEMIFKKP